jgi:hypothetical protein
MKKFLIIILTAAILAVSGCRKYDDSHVWDELFDLAVEQQKQAERLAALEAWQATVNDNISALETIVDALANNDYVTAVTPFTDPAPGGYYIDFSKSGRATIKNGEQGEQGATPQIGVAQYPDDSGIYYWTLDGEWLLDGNSEKIPVTGKDGEPGANGITPKLRINAQDNYWQVCASGTCADEGDWEYVLDSNGDKVKATGEQGDAIFAEDGVDYTSDDYVEFTLADGTTTIQVPKYCPLSITLDPYGVFAAHSEQQNITFSYTGDVQSITPVNVPGGWTVSEATFNHGDKQGTFTVTAPADDGLFYTAAGTATLLVSDGAERTITKPLPLECPPYVTPAALGISFAQPAPFCAGAIQDIEFTTTGNATTVKALDIPTGWRVTVQFNEAAAVGTFTVTAPATISEGEAVIMVSDDAGKMIMRTLGLTLGKPVVTTVSSPDICNIPATLTVTVGGCTTAAMTYTWDIGGTVTATDAPTTTIDNITATTTYTVTVTNDYGTTSAVSAAGTISIACSVWEDNTCSITFVSNTPDYGHANWANASALCAAKGMRLPTVTELQCMCNNKSDLPGGYSGNEFWSSNTSGSNAYIVRFSGNYVCTSAGYHQNNSSFIRCVK